jgi:Platelet-activating factor acetylhydrolase, isoform II
MWVTMRSRQAATSLLILYYCCAYYYGSAKGFDICKAAATHRTPRRTRLFATTTTTTRRTMQMNRKQFFARQVLVAAAAVLLPPPPSVQAWTMPSYSSSSSSSSSINAMPLPTEITRTTAVTTTTAAYKSLWLPIDEFDVTVPIACWFPTTRAAASAATTTNTNQQPRPPAPVSYNHRISIRKIGQLLAKWNFIPDFVARPYTLEPSTTSTSTRSSSLASSSLEQQVVVVNGQDLELPRQAPVVLLAHGFLGSRFDLSHLGEELAAEGFVVLSAEYPESLAASYSPSQPAAQEGEGGGEEPIRTLTRQCINDNLLQYLSSSKECNVQASKFGIVGHSLGCGTVVNTGDRSWARVCIAGGPPLFEKPSKNFNV